MAYPYPYPGPGTNTTRKGYKKVKGSVGAGTSRSGSSSAPGNPSKGDGGYAQGVKDSRSRNADRNQSAK